MTSQDILQYMAENKQLREIVEQGDDYTFAGLATIAGWVLWKNYGWNQTRLQRFYQIYNDYRESCTDDDILSELNERLWNKAEFCMEVKSNDTKDVEFGNVKALKKLAEDRAYYYNEINYWSARCMCLIFNSLIDLGFGKKRLERMQKNMGLVINSIGSVSTDQLRADLYDNCGIFIEFPTDGKCVLPTVTKVDQV